MSVRNKLMSLAIIVVLIPLLIVGTVNQIASVPAQSAAATQEINASVEEQKNAIASIMHSSPELHTEAERMHDLVERFT